MRICDYSIIRDLSEDNESAGALYIKTLHQSINASTNSAKRCGSGPSKLDVTKFYYLHKTRHGDRLDTVNGIHASVLSLRMRINMWLTIHHSAWGKNRLGVDLDENGQTQHVNSVQS